MAAEPDDINDDGRGLAPPLGDYVGAAYGVLYARFRENDEEALAQQKEHYLLARRAALLGIAALVVGGAGAAFDWRWLSPIEFLLAGAAVWVVVAGIRAYRKEEWLLKRWKAEQLRLLKYRFLLDPELWSDPPIPLAPKVDALARQRDAVESTGDSDLDTRSHQEDIPAFPTPAECERMNPNLVSQLVRYYRERRLAFQRKYFQSKSQAPKSLLGRPEALPLFFFGGVLFIFLHFLAELAVCAKETSSVARFCTCLVGWPPSPVAPEVAEHPQFLPLLFIFLAGALPATWAGLRTYRQSREIARNVLRSQARHTALSQVDDALDGSSVFSRTDLRAAGATPGGPLDRRVSIAPAAQRGPDPVTAFASMNLAEFILASDQREWLRLMIEAEWYG